MPDRPKELADLAKADKDIRAAELRIAEQMALIQWLSARGESTEDAANVLRTFEETLKTFRVHRQLIVETLERT